MLLSTPCVSESVCVSECVCVCACVIPSVVFHYKYTCRCLIDQKFVYNDQYYSLAREQFSCSQPPDLTRT